MPDIRPYVPGQVLKPGETLIPGPQGRPVIVTRPQPGQTPAATQPALPIPSPIPYQPAAPTPKPKQETPPPPQAKTPIEALQIAAYYEKRPGMVAVGVDVPSLNEHVYRADFERLKDSYPALVDTLKRKGVEALNTQIKQHQRDIAWQESVKVRPVIVEPKQKLSPADYVIIGNHAMPLNSWKGIQEKYQAIAIDKGWDAMFNAMVKDQQELSTAYYSRIEKKEKAALEILKPYTNKDGSVYIYSFIVDTKRPGGILPASAKEAGISELARYKAVSNVKDGEQVLRDAGFSYEDIQAASSEAKSNAWQRLTPWEESKGEKATVKGATVMAAEMLVPGVYTARHWKDLSTGEKVFNIVIDAAAIILPTAKAAGVAGRTVAGTATRVGVMKAAGRAALVEAGRTVIAPVNAIIHPVGTAKAAFNDIRNLVEVVGHPGRLPAMSVYTSEGTVRLLIKGNISEARALAIRDQLMEAVKNGERAYIKIGNQTIELRRSALMKELPGGLTHATPQGNFFEDVLKVERKPGMPASEQGLFVAPDPVPRFAETSAFGKAGEKPLFYIMSPETASKTISSEKIYTSPIGKVAEFEAKLPVKETTKGAGQKLFTRIGPTGTKVEIWLEEGLKLSKAQIAKLKAEGLVEWIKSPFEPALKIKGKGPVIGLTEKETDRLATVLREAGAVREARELQRAYRLAEYSRASTPVLFRLGRGFNSARVKAEAERIRLEELQRITPSTRAAISRLRLPESAADRLRRDLVITSTIARRIQSRLQEPSRLRPEIIRVAAARGITPREVQTGRAERMTAEEQRRAIERVEGERERPITRAEIERAAARVERIERKTGRAGRDIERIEAERGRVTGREERIRLAGGKAREEIPKKKGKLTDKEKRAIIKASSGFTTQNMGKLHDKDVWWVHLDSGESYVVLGKKPEGARIEADGPGSTYKTTQRIGSKRDFIPYSERRGAVMARVTPTRTPKGAEASFSPVGPSRKVGKMYATNIGGATGYSRRPIKRGRKS